MVGVPLRVSSNEEISEKKSLRVFSMFGTSILQYSPNVNECSFEISLILNLFVHP